jgi:hypothetical protein
MGSGLDGVFVDGVWEGHIYTNSVDEADNPTPIAAVTDALKSSVTSRIDAFRGASDTGAFVDHIEEELRSA